MRYGRRLVFLTVMISILSNAHPVWAGEWVGDGSGQWTYNENEELLKGWNKINGVWYYLDTETGIWIEKPAMTADSACHLLENKLQELNLYQDEEEPLQFKADYETDKLILISVGYEEKPDVFHRINTYEIDKKKGTADPVIGDKEFSLW